MPIVSTEMPSNRKNKFIGVCIVYTDAKTKTLFRENKVYYIVHDSKDKNCQGPPSIIRFYLSDFFGEERVITHILTAQYVVRKKRGREKKTKRLSNNIYVHK
jgi:hypothetical protein